MSPTKSAQRKSWIDCAKLMAILAVAVDHTNQLFYTNPIIARGSYYSVSLFILLAGIGARLSFTRKSDEIVSSTIYIYIYQLKKLLKIYVDYAIATAVLMIWYLRFFDLKTYVNHLLNFSIQGPYYFLVFYVQLLLITPLLTAWNEYCNRRRLHLLWNGLTLLALCCFSSVCIRYTYILPVHGGGQYLFGGTYLILYYLGILLEGYRVFERSRRQRAVLLAASGAGWALTLLMNCAGRPLDRILEPYWGRGGNPPGPQIMLLSIFTLFFCYSFYSLLEEAPFGGRLVKPLAFLGRHTLYTFLYHLLVRDVLLHTVLAGVQNIWALRVLGFLPMIVLPPVAVWGARKFAALLRNRVGLPV